MSGGTLASLHYSTLRLSVQERFALTAPEKRVKQSTRGGGEKGRGRKEKAERREGKEEKGRRRRRKKEESAGSRGPKNTNSRASFSWLVSF